MDTDEEPNYEDEDEFEDAYSLSMESKVLVPKMNTVKVKTI